MCVCVWFFQLMLTYIVLFSVLKSLLALTTVVKALSQPTKKKPRHINYRDSKLTRILQPHLSGNAEMAILCCASRSKKFIEETRSTLKFASRAKYVQMKPKINEVTDDSAIIRKLQNQLLEVQKELELTKKKLEEELNQKADITKPTLNVEKATPRSPTHDDSIVDEKTNVSGFQSDAGDLDAAKKAVQRYQNGDSFDPIEFLNSSQASTANSSSECNRSNEKRNLLPSTQKSVGQENHKTEFHGSPVPREDDNFDRPDTNCSDSSFLNVCSQVSNPETIRGTQGVDHRQKSEFERRDSEAFSPNGRLEKKLSWDEMAFSTNNVASSGKSIRPIESLSDKRNLIPGEITTIGSAMTKDDHMCLADRLKNYEEMIQFLQEKLESSDTVIEASSIDLQRARHCIRDLVQRNVEMKVQLSKKARQDSKKDYERFEIMVEQHWLLKISLYGSLFFFLSGSQEYFLATAFFVWLALEMNVTA